MKTNRGKIQGRDAKTQATDGRPIYLRMAESMLDEGGPGSGPRKSLGTPTKSEMKNMSSGQHFDAVQVHTHKSGEAHAQGHDSLAKYHKSMADAHHNMRVMKDKIQKTKSVGYGKITKDKSGLRSEIAAHKAAADKSYKDAIDHGNNIVPKKESKKEGAGTYGPAAFLNQVFTKVLPKRFDKVIKQEADSSTGLSGLVRKESSISFRSVRFMEKGEAPKPSVKAADRGIGTTRFRAVMLQEGLGNFGDAYYYSKAALDSAAPVFEGKKIYADHPSAIDEQVRPERSVRDVLGHFENVHVEQLDDGRSQLIGDVVILPDDSFAWARSLMGHAVAFHEKFPDKEFIGLSINASGDAEPTKLAEFMKSELPESVMTKLSEAVGKGIDEIKIVSALTEAVSCDLVTEAGAGGSVTNLIESNKLNLEGENMKPKSKVKENESEMKPVDAAPEEASVDSATHDDAAQDVELIKGMLKKSFGGEADPSEEECAMAKEAIEAFGDMGHPKEKCHEMAMEFMKASKHMAAKHAEKAKESEAEEKPESEEKPVEAASEEEVPEEKPAVKESAKMNAEVIKLRGELASYREQDKKRAVAAHVEKVCKESKRSNAFTTEFKAVVKEAKSVEEVNKAWKLFEAGSKHSAVNTDDAFEGITFSNEKLLTTADGERSDLSFDDCTVY